MASNLPAPNIPSDIIADILSNLEIKPLCRFKSVSKPWLVMINHLIKNRLGDKSEKLIITSDTYPYSFYSLNAQSPKEPLEIKTFSECRFEIISSYNGVLLLSSNCSSLFFWNPYTRMHRLISPGTHEKTVIQGLCYDSSRNDFKVVWSIRRNEDNYFNPNRTYVFSSVSSDWKRINDLEYYPCVTASPSGVVVNGSPYWIASRVRGCNEIIYFDPCDEIFQELLVPHQRLNFYNFRLTVLSGNLGGVKDNYVNYSTDIWVMKDSTWNKLFVVPRWQGELSIRVLNPLCFMNEGELSCKDVAVQLNTRALALYTIKENKFKNIQLPEDCERFDAICYAESLAFPKSTFG